MTKLLLAFLCLIVYATPVRAETLINFTHDAGTLGEYTLSNTDNGDLAVTTQAALAGSKYGVQATIDDSLRIYATKMLNPVSTTGVMRARFYFDYNSLYLGPSEQLSFIFFGNSSGTSNFAQIKIMNINGTYHLRGVMIDDNETHRETTQTWPITKGPHYIEIMVKRSSSATANSGTFDIWIDGQQKPTMTGVDSFNKFSDFKYASIGLINAGGTIRGTYYIDEIKINNDGSEIGPIQTGPKPGDLNNSGMVDIFDYNILVSSFGNPYTIFDYNTLISNFGR